MIPRLIQKSVTKALLETDKIIIVLGARQTGKTTLLTQIRKQIPADDNRFLKINCDSEEGLTGINTTSIEVLKQLLSNKKYLFIDEAQRIDNPGLTLKIIHDNFPGLKVLVTGSSSFEIKNALSDPLTGRYLDFILYPFAYEEINPQNNRHILDSILTYGEYPEVFLEPQPEMKRAYLAKITESFLFKDILSFSKIRNSQAIVNLARALAYQIGSEINENELASRIKIDRKTLVSYLDILEKSFVIIKLHPFSQNPRREIGRRYKVYFVDLGTRNQLTGQFGPLALREDFGHLWKNFLIIERRKYFSRSLTPPPCFFWRNLNGAEVDYLELAEGKIKAFEFKSKDSKRTRFPPSFVSIYKITPSLVTPANFASFINPGQT